MAIRLGSGGGGRGERGTYWNVESSLDDSGDWPMTREALVKLRPDGVDSIATFQRGGDPSATTTRGSASGRSHDVMRHEENHQSVDGSRRRRRRRMMMFGSVSLFVDGSGTQEDVSNSSSVQLSLSLSLSRATFPSVTPSDCGHSGRSHFLMLL